jgi:glycosyltransferase involved in cell wall biosynthesis
MPDQPLVSIGLPTYNRAASLRRSLASALGQTYPNLELIISDNASTDDTEAVCLEAARRDGRVKYLRQPSNQGAVKNYRAVLAEARGEYFMWLGDDDWLDDAYIARCAQALGENPDHSLVCGRDKYYENGEFVLESIRINLPEDSAAERVRSYYRQVTINGTFYGLMRREQITRVPFYDVFAGDWLFVAQVALLGKVKTLESVAINRSVSGASQDIQRLAAKSGLSKFMVRNPHLKIALIVFGDLVWGSPLYRTLSLPTRLALGCDSFVAICKRYCVPDWHQRLYGRAKRVEAVLKQPFRSVQ